jgi:hypothetical protein
MASSTLLEGGPLSREELLDWLKSRAAIREPTAEERRLAAEWEALPEEQKRTVAWELDHASDGPTARDLWKTEPPGK